MTTAAFELPVWLNIYKNIPYKSKGRTLEGVDCYGIVRMIFAERFGIMLPSYSDNYTDASDTLSTSGAILEHLDTDPHWVSVRQKDAYRGDVVLLTIHGTPMHMGLVVSTTMMLHTLKGHNSCLESWNGVRWASRIYGFYRYATKPDIQT